MVVPPLETMQAIDRMLSKLPTEFAFRWCTAAGGCACLGCASMFGGLVKAGYTQEDWEAWKRWKATGNV
jgi:hypothetical protein